MVFPTGTQPAQMFEPAEGLANRQAMAVVVFIARRQLRTAAQQVLEQPIADFGSAWKANADVRWLVTVGSEGTTRSIWKR